MEDSDQDREKQTPEKKSSILGGGLVWYVVAFALAGLFLASLTRSDSRAEIKIGRLEDLIAQGNPTENTEAAIEVTEGKDKRAVTVRYSNLDDLMIGPAEIRGTVTREVISPPDKKEEAKDDIPFVTGRLGVRQDDNALPDLLKANGFKDYSSPGSPGFMESFGPTLLFFLITIPFLIFLLRRMGGAGGAMAFGRSRGKLVAQEDVEVTFDDVAGVDEAVDELREVVEFLETPEKYRVLGGRIPKGVLLVGPPGTGKTLLAKAVAGEAGVPFFSLSGSDFVEMFVGVGAARVRDMFQQAESRSPCIIFIDELDALGKTRGSGMVGGHDEREQTLNALLVEMDGFNSNAGTIVMAATNRPETLDPALLRAGRFDRQVLVDRPDIRGREAILKVHVKTVKLDDEINLKRVASITPGFCGADLAALVNEAALLAARGGKPAVTMLEFTEGVERVTAGLEKRNRVMHEDEKQRVAYHESAHALVAYTLPNTDPVHKVSIIPRGMAALGYTMQRPEDERYLLTQSELESRIQVLLGGTVAEEIILDDVSTGAQNDLERATEIARGMVMDYGMSRLGRVNYRENNRNTFLGGDSGFPSQRLHSEHTAREIDEEIRRIIETSLEKVRHILATRKTALLALAERLVEKEVIDGEELREVMEANSPNAAIVPGTASTPKRPAESDKPSTETSTDPEQGESAG